MDFLETMRLQQMMGGILSGNNSWITAVCLFGLFALVIFRRESILNWGQFRLAYLFLAASIVIPPLIAAGFQAEPGAFTRGGGPPSSFAGNLTITLALNAPGPLFLALAVICAFGSVLPRNLFSDTRPVAPQKHPLD